MSQPRRNFSPAQLAYLTARANLDVLTAELDILCPDCADNATEAEVNAWAEAMEVQAEALGMDKARDDLRAAKKALIAWVVEVVAPLATPKQAATIRGLAANYRAQDRLVELAMRLAA